jgi:alpha/beta superfamily hydrolase
MESSLKAEAAIVIERVTFRAGAHRLQGELAYPDSGQPTGIAVIAGPHPLLGGNLHNNVVRRLGDGLAARTWASLRFNYRGVGQSEGPRLDIAANLARFWATSHVPDEMDLWHDVDGAIAFVKDVLGRDLPMVMIGYSFGCALLPYITDSASALVAIAPTVSKHDYASYRRVGRPLLVIASEDDFAADMAEVERWFNEIDAPKQLIRQRLDNHFFRGHEDWLAQAVFDFLHAEGVDLP